MVDQSPPMIHYTQAISSIMNLDRLRSRTIKLWNQGLDENTYQVLDHEYPFFSQTLTTFLQNEKSGQSFSKKRVLFHNKGTRISYTVIN